MIHTIKIEDFLSLQDSIPLADVRTPAEFTHGHIPHAWNLPLFSNEERVVVGTTYKQVGREQAILLGFDLVGTKWSGFIRESLKIAPQKQIAVHCWRGGMRSGAMAWALDLYGFEVYLIEGGYKSYRRWARTQFEKQYRLTILGGMTGSGKTKILHELQLLGEQIIDLEDLAQHQGSSYGSMNKMVQPSQEQFENNLAHQLKDFDQKRKLWVEDENLTIGKLFIPRPFWNSMKQAPVINLKVDLQQRINELVEAYGCLDKDFLVNSTERIHKRLGPLQTKQAIAAIRENRMIDFIRLVLVYYDKAYQNELSKKKEEELYMLPLANTNRKENAVQLVNFTQSVVALHES